MDSKEQDIVLVKEAQAGDEEAFGVLVRRYQEGLYLLALQMVSSPSEAEDLAAEVFVRAWRQLKTFRNEANFKTWLWRITINTCRSHLRHRYLHRKIFFWQKQLPDDEDDQQIDPPWIDTSTDGDPQRYTEQNSLRQRIVQARDTLSPREKEVFALKYDQQLKINEISRILSLSENTVKVLLFRAAKKMASALRDYHDGR